MQNFDVVYILKDNIASEELRYSLRSIDLNFPAGKVWFIGGQPRDLIPDARIAHKQSGMTKWQKAFSSLVKVLECNEVSDPFYLFNDDFFVMKPFRGEFINYSDGTLEKKICRLINKVGQSTYTLQLESVRNKLLSEKYDTISYALHLPMMIYKKDLAEALRFGTPFFRSIVGNISGLPYIYHSDVKIYDNFTKPDKDADFLSTTEESFEKGEVGKFIRNAFPEPSRFEPECKVNVSERYTEEGDEIKSIGGV